jgi:2-haloacid dehalogenase
MEAVNAIIFDLGGVLVDWNPQYLYRKIFASQKEVDDFLSTVCTLSWNEHQDAGRSLKDGTALLIREFPHYKNEIRAYYDRWEEMLGGPVEGTVEILRSLKEKPGLSLYALTNWSDETIPIALERYDFLHWFDGMVVSGKEKMRKPFREFYQLIIDRYHLSAPHTLFIDDNLRNIRGAEAMGLQTIHFTSPAELRQTLQSIQAL